LKTFDLLEASAFLRMHPETLRRLAVAGEIPGAKPGKHWLFLDEDLVEWLRSRYSKKARGVEASGTTTSATVNLMAGGNGGASPHQTVKKYEDLLERRPRNAQRNTKRFENN